MSKQPSGLIIGQKGVQYGLQKVAPKKTGPTGGPAVPRKVAPTNVFGDDDSEEEDVERQIARQADKKRAAAKVQQMYEDALAADPSVFDYDGVYDSIQEARVAPKQQDKVQRHSKYISSLLEQAQQRKREQDVLYERRMVKERQQEDHLYEDKERFVTGAYRRKLEEDKKWQEAERQRELEEERNDVRKVGHMGNFYANLLTKNVAFGTAKHEEKEPQQEAGKMEGKDELAGRAGSRDASSPSPELNDTPPEGSPPPRGGAPGAGAKGTTAASEGQGAAAKVLAQLDRYDVLRLEAERALRNKKLSGAQGPQGEGSARELAEPPRDQLDVSSAAGVGPGAPLEAAGADSEQLQQGQRQTEGALGGRYQEGEVRASVGSSKPEAPGGRGATGEAVGAGALGGAAAAAGGTVAPAAVGKRRNDDTSVQSAKERYLARKQQRTG